MKSFSATALLFIALLSGSVIAAETACDDTSDCINRDSWYLGIAFGYGVKSNPLKDYQDIPIYLLPTVAYYGDKWFFDNGTFGYTLKEDKHLTLNLATGYSSDRAFFHRWDLSNFFMAGSSQGLVQASFGRSLGELTPTIGALEERDFTYLGGIEAFIYHRYLTWRLALLHDLFDVHNGMEGQIKSNYHLNHRNLSIDLAAFLDWKSKEVVNYYYGVRPSESAYWSLIYQAENGWNSGLELTARYHMTPEWELLMTARYTRFADTISDSPLLDEGDSYAYLLGAAYRF